MEALEPAAVLDNEMEGHLLDECLSEGHIPHVIRSYHDSAYDGVFMIQTGWGRVDAPPAFHAAVRERLAEIRRQRAAADDAPEERTEQP